MEPDRSAGRREDDVARLIAAVEEVESRDWLDNFEKPARRKLARRGLEEDEIDGAIANVRREAARLDGQVVRFLNFLDDQALTRVRLAVTFAIMSAIKEAAQNRSDLEAQLLVRFVENVEALIKTFCDTEETLELDLSRDYGVAAKISISDKLRSSMYFGCLPVWAEWVNQMFEFRPIGGGSLAREVSYRFRINGDNPKERQSAFLTRLAWYEEDLLALKDEPVAPNVIGRDLAELFLLRRGGPFSSRPDEACRRAWTGTCPRGKTLCRGSQRSRSTHQKAPAAERRDGPHRGRPRGDAANSRQGPRRYSREVGSRTVHLRARGRG
jgi:hypothetical protein